MTHDEYFPGSNERLHAWIVGQRSQGRTKCWVCGHDWSKSNAQFRRAQTHHIERKSHCYPEYAHVECNLFTSCEQCHMGPLATMSHALQLAHKLKNDPENFNLQMWLHCRDGPVLRDYEPGNERVTQAEVDLELDALGA